MDIVIYFVLFVIILYVLGSLFSKKDKKSAFNKYLPGKEGKNKFFLKPDKEKVLQEKLYFAGLDMKPYQFVRMKIVIPLFVSVCFLLGALASGSVLYQVGVLASLTLYYYPDVWLKKRIKSSEGAKKMELPELLIPLSQLLRTHTVLEAVQKSERYAGPYLKPMVSRLVTELEAYPGSDLPFKNFAESIDLTEGHAFVLALQQSQKMSKKQSIEIMESQVALLRELKNENYNYLIQNKPLEMTKYNVGLIGCMVVYPLVIVVNSLIKGFLAV